MNKGLTLDGVFYKLHVSSLKRHFQVLDGENAERADAGNIIRDVIGTYYNYSMTIENAVDTRSDYDAFYEEISAPVESHILTVPYAQGTMTFEAYVTAGEDNLELMDEDGTDWNGLTVQFIACEPKRVPA